MTNTNTQPTAAQIQALKQYAAENGRYWKGALRNDWQTSSARVNGELSAELQQVRNTFGPSWLTRFNVEKA